MTVTLGTTPNSNWQAIASLLQALGCVPSDQANPETWYLGEQNLPEGKLLLAYTSPKQALVYAMENGQEPVEALKQWEEHTQALINRYKGNRRRAVLLNIEHVSKNLRMTADALASHWEQDIDLPDAPEKNSEHIVNPHYQLVAVVAIHQNKYLAPLLAQLEACSLPVLDQEQSAETEQDINALYWGLEGFRKQSDELEALRKQYQSLEEQHLALKERSEAAQIEKRNQDNALQAAREENELLLEQLHSVQEELDWALLAYKEEQAVSATLRSDIEELRAELTQAEAKHQAGVFELEKESQLLLEQLHLVQEELERKLLTSKEEKTVSDALRSQVEELKAALEGVEEKRKAESAELERLQKSLNTVQTQQIKHGGDADKLRQELEKAVEERKNIVADLDKAQHQRKQIQATLEEENQLVIEQLHLVQEELETQLLNKQRLEKQLKQFTSEQDHALALANSQINRLQNELYQLKTSAAWKAAAPVRALGRPFKRTPPEKRKLKKQAMLLADSQYFDADWYLKTYPDVAEKKMNPAEHYLKFGADEGRDPSKDFDTQWYVQANPDVQESGINPLIHFLNHGQAEGRAPNPQAQTSLPSPQEVK